MEVEDVILSPCSLRASNSSASRGGFSNYDRPTTKPCGPALLFIRFSRCVPREHPVCMCLFALYARVCVRMYVRACVVCAVCV